MLEFVRYTNFVIIRGEVAKQAAVRKCDKYADISSTYTFLPIALETLGPMNDLAYRFLEELGRRTSDVSVTAEKVPFLFQRLSATIQRFNAALFRETFAWHDDPDH